MHLEFRRVRNIYIECLTCRCRRTVAYPSYRCFYQEHGTEVVQVVADEPVLNPVFTGDSEEANLSIFPLEDEAVAEVSLPTMQVICQFL